MKLEEKTDESSIIEVNKIKQMSTKCMYSCIRKKNFSISKETLKSQSTKISINNDEENPKMLKSLGELKFFECSIESKLEFESNLKNFQIKNILIGKGAYGDIYLIRNDHLENKKKYALKVINKDRLKRINFNPKIILNEIDIHSKLYHPYIVKVKYFKETKDNYLILMDYCKNGNLYTKINNLNKISKGFSEETSFKYFIQTLSAIYFLQKHNLVHRDIKPENILLDEFNNIKLSDFGWCDYLNKENLFHLNETCGTYEYMAPEVILNKRYNYKIDNWALGILLYELLHGYSPFSKNATIDFSRRISNGKRDSNGNYSIYRESNWKLSSRESNENVYFSRNNSNGKDFIVNGNDYYKHIYKSPYKANSIFDNSNIQDKGEDKQILERIINGKYFFKEELSNEVKDLIFKLLKVNPNDRISLDDVFNHPWIVNKKIKFSICHTTEDKNREKIKSNICEIIKFPYSKSNICLTEVDKKVNFLTEKKDKKREDFCLTIENKLNKIFKKQTKKTSSSIYRKPPIPKLETERKKDTIKLSTIKDNENLNLNLNKELSLSNKIKYSAKQLYNLYDDKEDENINMIEINNRNNINKILIRGSSSIRNLNSIFSQC